MEMAPYCFGGGDAEWYRSLESNFPPLCSSPSLDMSVGDHLPIAAAPTERLSGTNDLESFDRGALIADHCSSSALIPRDEDNYHLPIFSAQAPPAAGDPYYFNQLPPMPADGTTAGLDDALLLQPFSDIDLEAFGDADEHKAPLADDMMIVPADGYAVGQNAGVDDGHGDHKPMGIADCYFNVAVMRNGEHHQTSSVAAMPPPPPPPVPRPQGRRSGDRSALAAKTRLDHIGFDEIRKYFYMPITKAAREMNVGLTVLKKRCRELGVARWPHRKMKSLKSLIHNVQEMGKGMSAAAVQRELAALETYCALMEKDPSIELSERTKKLRQACFKESYKRRRAASVQVIDHIYNYDVGDDHQLPLQTTSSSAGSSESSNFFGY